MSSPVNAHPKHPPLSIAQAEKRLEDLRLQLAASPDGGMRSEIQQRIATLEAMIPVYRAFEKLLASVSACS